MSTKSTFAPQYKPQFELATKVLGTVQRKSPGLRFNERHDKQKKVFSFYETPASILFVRIIGSGVHSPVLL